MSVQVLDQIEYFQIAKSLKLNYDFTNRLFEANQKAYDISYNLIQEIESLDRSTFNNNNYDSIDPTKLNYLIRKIRYNIYPNDQESILNKSDLKTLDLLVFITQEKKPSEDLIKWKILFRYH